MYERQNYVDEIKRVPITDVANRLGLKLHKTGNTLRGNCPTGHASKHGNCFCIVIDGNYFHCFHDGCDAAGDVIRLIEIVKDFDFKEAVSWLGNEFNIITPKSFKEPTRKTNYELYKNAALYEELYQYGRYLLFQSDGAEARQYLLSHRGYTEETLKKTEWIFFPPEDIAKAHLIDKFPEAEEQIKKLHLDSFREITYWAAFPYRNRDGLITGFLKRALNPSGYNVTYKNGKVANGLRWNSTFGTNKHDLFNLHRCKGQEWLIILEGYPDAILLPTMGLENVVAVGQGKLSNTHIEGLDEFGVRNVIISFDNDTPDDEGNRPGMNNTIDAVKLLLDETRINVFVIDPDLLDPYKDPDELVRAMGVDWYYELIANAEAGASWLAKKMLEKYDDDVDLQKQQALDEACELLEKIDNRIAYDQFIEALANGLKMNIEAIKDYIGEYKQRIERARINEEYKKLTSEAEYLRSKGDLEEASKLIEEKGLILKNELYKTKIKPITSLSDRLRGKYEFEKNRPDGLLGYPLEKFKKLAEYIDGIQPGLYIIGAETNVGKTAMLTNIGLDIIQSNDNVRTLYLSLDDSWKVISNRFLGIITDLELNQVQRRQSIPANERKRKEGYEYLISLYENERLDIADLSNITTFNQAEALIREKYDDDLVILVDGIFNLQVENDNANIREQNVQRANKLKAIVDIYNVPLICTAELRKKSKEEGINKKPTVSDLMETGKFGYNANVVWLLFPDDAMEAKNEKEYPIKLDYAKNKLSHFKDYQPLLFKKTKGIVEEYNDLVASW